MARQSVALALVFDGAGKRELAQPWSFHRVMNKIEAIKQERDGLDVRETIAAYARSGWKSIPDDDIQRLKWCGLFLRNPTPGFFMIRVRIPGGRTGSYQVRALADIAHRYGNGVLDLTTRQQIQLRQIPIEHVPAIFERMDEVGLSSMQTGMDNVRNIMTCPVAGLTPDELLDATPLVSLLTQEILYNREYSNLPRKFNISVTGCLENCLHAETQDLALVPAWIEHEGVKQVGYNVLAGGKLGSGGYRIASPLDIFTLAHEALDVCRAIMQLYRDLGPRENRQASRLAFLLEDWGVVRFRQEVEARVGRALSLAGTDARKSSSHTHTGIYRQRQAGLNYVGLKVIVGRLAASDLSAIAALSERYGNGDIRISPAQMLLIPNVTDRKIGDLTEDPVVKRFAYNPSPLQQGLVSCVGSDYCNLAVIETKTRAVQTARELESSLETPLKPLTMHWSGCPAGCGNHLVADIGLLGKKAKVDGRVVDAVDVFVGGRSGPDPKLAVKLLEDVPCSKLASVLGGLVPYHTRDKMHRVRGRDAKVPNRPMTGTKASASVTVPVPLLNPV